MDISIRPYAETDLDTVVSIWLKSWQSTGVSVASTAQLSVLRERFPVEIAVGWLVYVARVGADVVGFLAFHDDYLSQMFIAPEWQSKGIGKQLLDFVRVQMPGGFWLTTAVESGGACRFYEREGLARGEISIHPNLGHEIVRYDWRPGA